MKKRKLDRLKNEADVALQEFQERAQKHEKHISRFCTCDVDKFENIAKYKHRKAYHFRTRNYIRPLVSEHLPVTPLVSIIVSYLTSTIEFCDGLDDKKKKDEKKKKEKASNIEEVVVVKKENQNTQNHQVDSAHLRNNLSVHVKEVPNKDHASITLDTPGWRALYNDPENLAYVAMQRKLAAQQIADRVAYGLQFPFDREAIRRRKEQATKKAAELEQEIVRRAKIDDAKAKFTAADLAERITEHVKVDNVPSSSLRKKRRRMNRMCLGDDTPVLTDAAIESQLDIAQQHVELRHHGGTYT